MVKEKVVANSANMQGKIEKKFFVHLGGTYGAHTYPCVVVKN